jgi:hypothetical protein
MLLKSWPQPSSLHQSSFFSLDPNQVIAQAPSVAGTSPNCGGVGSSIEITGSNFGATQDQAQ